MKKALLSAILLMSFPVLFAQPNLTAPFMNPLVGETFIGYECDARGVTMGAAGAGVTWNYAFLSVLGYDTTGYFTCAATPYCDSYSTSNIVALNSGEYDYEIESSSSLSLIGGNTGSVYFYLTDPLDEMFYPATYHSTHKDTGVGYGILAGIGGDYETDIDSFNADAYGTLILPSGTYPNTLRIHVISVSKDSEVFFGVPTVTVAQTEAYLWYDSSFHNQLLEIDYDTAGSTSLYVSGVEYYTSHLPLSVSKTVSDAVFLKVFPNPATNDMNISLDLADNKDAFISISDMLGRVVGSFPSGKLNIGANNLTFPVQDLPNGMYIVQLHSPQGNVNQKVVIAK